MRSSATTCTAGAQDRADISGELRSVLADECARRISVRRWDTRDVLQILPKFGRNGVYHLRNRKTGELGLERLLFAAQRLDIPLKIRIGDRVVRSGDAS